MKRASFNRIGSIILFFLLTSLILSCLGSIDGKGPIISESREIGQFTEITLDIPANITLVISDSAGCVMSAQKNIIDNIEIKRNGNKLRIKSKSNYRCNKPVEITIATPELENITINGSGDINVLNSVKGNSLKLNINGSGNITLNANVEDLVSKINGTGDINLIGKSSSHKIDINGSGNIKAADLETEKCKINLKGSGDAAINVNTKLDVRLIGSGDVTYKGSPTINVDITGSGSVTKIN